MKINFETLSDKYGTGLAILIAILIVPLALGIAFGFICLQGWIFMLLWNWLAVELFGAAALGYWVCVGIVFALNFLGNLVFGHHSHSTKTSD